MKQRVTVKRSDAYNKSVGIIIDEGVVEIEDRKPVHECRSTGRDKTATEQGLATKRTKFYKETSHDNRLRENPRNHLHARDICQCSRLASSMGGGANDDDGATSTKDK